MVDDVGARRDDPIYDMCAREPLSPEEEREVGLRARDGDEDAQGLLVEHNLRFARQEAARLHEPLGLEFEDAFQAAALGLLKAARRFDPDEGKFTSYAVWWVQRELYREQGRGGRSIAVGSSASTEATRVRRTWDELRRDLAREPTVEEVAEDMGLPQDRVRDLARLARVPVTLGEEGEEGVPLPLLSGGSPQGQGNPVARRRARRAVAAAVERLKADHPREAVILIHRYGLDGDAPWSYLRIGTSLGITGERVRQLKQRAVRRLGRDPKLREDLHGIITLDTGDG